MFPPRNSFTHTSVHARIEHTHTEKLCQWCDCADKCEFRTEVSESEKEHTEESECEDILYLPCSCRARIVHKCGLKRDTQSIRIRSKSTVSRSTLYANVVLCAAIKSVWTILPTVKISASSSYIHRAEGACVWVWARRKTQIGGLLHKQRATNRV